MRGRAPGLVFTGPFTGVRDQVTGLYAERLAAAGFVTLAFDHRNFGESGGQPRRHEDPQGKLTDLRAAVSLLRARPEADLRGSGPSVSAWAGASAPARHVASVMAGA